MEPTVTWAVFKKMAGDVDDFYVAAAGGDEPEWWLSQLANEAACEQHGVPFAVRFGFPTGSPCERLFCGARVSGHAVLQKRVLRFITATVLGAPWSLTHVDMTCRPPVDVAVAYKR